jgi:hypothetical protein
MRVFLVAFRSEPATLNPVAAIPAVASTKRLERKGRYLMAKKVFTVPVSLTQVTDSAATASAAPKGKKNRPTRELVAGDLVAGTNNLSESQIKGINEGNIIASWATVDASDKAKNVAKAGWKWYIRLRCVNGEGMLQMCDDKIDIATTDGEVLAKLSSKEREIAEAKGACDHCNYGMDLERRRQTRDKLMTELEGPEKLIKKVVIGMVLSDDMTHDEIRQRILNNKKWNTQVDRAELERIVNRALLASA